MNIAYTFIIAALISTPASATVAWSCAAPQNIACVEANRDNLEIVKKLKVALKEDNKTEFAELIQYPLKTEKPLAAIKNSKEFVKRWNEYFNSEIIDRAIKSTPVDEGRRGISLSGNTIWFRQGKIAYISAQTKEHEDALARAQKADSKQLYKTAQNYKRNYFQCDTKSSHVRVLGIDRDLVFFSWKKGSDLASKPAIEQRGGVIMLHKSGSVRSTIGFNKDKEYTYLIELYGICEDCNDHVSVFKNGDLVSREPCISKL